MKGTHTYILDCEYPGTKEPSKVSHVKVSPLDLEECWDECVRGDPDSTRKVVRVQQVRPEIQIIMNIVATKLRLWELTRELEKLEGEALEVTEFIDYVCAGLDTAMTLYEHEELCAVMNQLHVDHRISPVDYSQYVREL